MTEIPITDTKSAKPIPAYFEVDIPESTPKGTGRRGRPPGSTSKTRVKADETLIKKTLYTAFSTTSFAFVLTGYNRLQLTEIEKNQLADVWTTVLMDYPQWHKWFDSGGKLTNVAQAMIVTVSIFFPKFTGVDLNRPVSFNQNGRDNSYTPTVPTGSETPTDNTDQTRGTRTNGGDNWLWENDVSRSIIGN